jgi:hypothetical protein
MQPHETWLDDTQCKCGDSSKIRDFIEVFFNSTRYGLRVVSEGFHGMPHGSGEDPLGMENSPKKKDIATKSRTMEKYMEHIKRDSMEDILEDECKQRNPT